MQITVEAVNKESKQARGQKYWGVKSGNDWYNLMVNDKPNRGDKFEVNVKESTFNNRTYRWATIDEKAQKKAELRTSGGITWDEYSQAAMLAWRLAERLEPDATQSQPDGTDIMLLDRSTARAAILNTAMIAFTNGKFSLPEEAEDPPPPDEDDNVPF